MQQDAALSSAQPLDISRAGVGEGGWLEGWLGCLLCLGGSERPCNTCNALPCISITFPQSFSLIHPHMRHRQPHTIQQAPSATSPMRDMLSCVRYELLTADKTHYRLLAANLVARPVLLGMEPCSGCRHCLAVAQPWLQPHRGG